jgi:hypothetical protein
VRFKVPYTKYAVGKIWAGLLIGLLALTAGVGWAQTNLIDLTHPGGLTRLLVESPDLVATSSTNFWFRPAGHFLLLTGPTSPVGGNPTLAGDESRVFASGLLALNNSLIGFTSGISLSIDVTNAAATTDPMIADVHDLMNAQATRQNNATTNDIDQLIDYWPQKLQAGARTVEGIARIPLVAASTDTGTGTGTGTGSGTGTGTGTASLAQTIPSTGEFIDVRHRYTLIHDQLMLEVIVTNPSSNTQSHYIGVRYLFDGRLTPGGKDGQPVIFPDGRTLTLEKVLPDTATGDPMPASWVMYDSQSNPSFAVRGVIDTEEATLPGQATSAAGLPDAVEFGTYLDLALSSFFFAPSGSSGFVNDDWAYATKWNERKLSPGESRRYVTYYGLGVAAADYTSPFSLAAYGPLRLVAQTGDDPATSGTTESFYVSDPQGRSPFPVSVYVDNFGPSTLTNSQVTIDLGDSGLELSPSTQSLTKSLGIVARNALASTTWTLRARPGAAGVATVKFSLSGKEVTRKIFIPAIPILEPKISAEGLSMVSVPFSFTNTDAEHVFQSLGGLTPGGNAALIRWDPSGTGQYRFFPDPYVTNVLPGQGFWLLNRTGATVNLPPDAAAVSQALSYEVPIKAGWNQVGTPFTLPQRFDNMVVVTSSGVEYTLQEAIDRSLVMGTVFTYNPATEEYEWTPEPTQIVLNPYVGYWLYADEDVTLRFLPPTTTIPTAARGLVAARQALSETNWQVGLVVSAAGQRRSGRVFGVSTTAGDGMDKGDLICPPAAAASGASLTAAFDNGQAALVRDLHAAGSSAPWHVRVGTSAANERVSITWPDLSALPAGMVAVLEDATTGQRCFMRTSASYSYDSGPNGGERDFTITVKPRSTVPAVVSAAEVGSAGTGFQVSYTLSAVAAVDIEVRNISGALVKSLAVAKPGDVGVNSVVWDGRSDSGTRLPNGRYICRITARSPETGQSNNVVRSFSVVR